MQLTDIINALFPIAFLIAAIALIWFIIELVLTVRKARSVVVDMQKRIEPTLESVEKITASLEPVAAKADPLMERVSLTVDAVNLELMRIDQILEDVNEVTDAVSSAAGAIDAAASAPLELVSKVSSRVRDAFKTRGASSESIELGEEKADKASQNRHYPESSHASNDMTGKQIGYQSATAIGNHHIDQATKSSSQNQADQGAPATDSDEGHYYTYGVDAGEEQGWKKSATSDDDTSRLGTNQAAATTSQSEAIQDDETCQKNDRN